MPYRRYREQDGQQGDDSGYDPNPSAAGEFRNLNDHALRTGADSRHASARNAIAGLRSLQVSENLIRILIAVVRVAFQTPHDDSHQPIRKIRFDQLRALG